MPLATALVPELGVNWSGDGVTYVDESARLLRFRIKAGRNSEMSQNPAGSAAFIVDNYDGRFTPEYTGGPLYGSLEVYRRIRFKVTFNAVTYSLFAGFLTDISPDVKAREATLAAIDYFGWLAEIDVSVAPATSVDTGTRISDVLAAAGIPAGDKVISTGETDLPFPMVVGENALQACQRLAEHELGGNFYCRGDGKIVFKHRHERAIAASVVTLTTPGDLTYERRVDGVYHRAQLKAGSYEAGIAGSQIWSLAPLPRAVAPGVSVVLAPRYQQAATAVTTPVSGTDWVANASIDGTGADKTAALASSFTNYGGAAEWTLGPNTDAATIYITRAQIRGTPVTADSSGRLVTRSTTGGAGEFDKTYRKDYPLISDVNLLGAFADYIVQHYSTPQPLLTLTLGMESDAVVAQILGRYIDDRITVVDTAAGYRTNANGDYFIESVEWSGDAKSNQIGSRWLLSSWLVDQFWILGTSQLGIDTVLGY